MVSKPFQLSPVFGHVSEYAWVALKWVKIEGGVYLQRKGVTFEWDKGIWVKEKVATVN